MIKVRAMMRVTFRLAASALFCSTAAAATSLPVTFESPCELAGVGRMAKADFPRVPIGEQH